MDTERLYQLKSQILVFLYLKSKALQDPYKDFIDVASLDAKENLKVAIDALVSEKLLEGTSPENIKLTTPGVYEMEAKYFNPTRSTNINIVQISQMVNSAIQQGSAEGKITMSIDDADKIKQFISKVDNHVDIAIINNGLIHRHANTENLIRRYHEQLLEELNSFRIIDFGGVSHRENHWGNLIQESLERMLPLRNKFLELYFGIIDNSTAPVGQSLQDLVSKLLQYNYFEYEYFSERSTEGYLRGENYRIFIYEVFLHLSTYMLKRENFNDLSFVLHYPYQIHLVEKRRGVDEFKSVNFTKFNIPTSLFNDEERRFQHGIHNDKNLQTEFVLSRVYVDYVDRDKLKETDVLLYYVSLFTSEKMEPIYWTPYTSKDGVQKVEIIQRSVSRKYFEKVRTIFNVVSDQEFIEKIKLIPKIQNQHSHIVQGYRIREYEFILNTQFLCTQV